MTTKPGILQCPKCDQPTAGENGLRRHYKQMHNEYLEEIPEEAYGTE